MKIAIVHDAFETLGGGETEMKMLAEGLSENHDVTIYTTFFDKSLPLEIDVPIVEIGRKFNLDGLKQTEMAIRFSKLDLDDYDTVITENYWTSFVRHKNHIHHCEAPIRQFYDLRKWFTDRMGFFKRTAFNIWAEWLIPYEQKAIKDCKLIVSNSKFTQERVRRYYKRDSIVIYPPVVTEKYSYKKTGNFWLYVGRLDYNKRIELMLNCFKESGKLLAVIGDGPLRKRAFEIVRGCNNIFLFGNIPEEDLIDFYATCMATIYLPLLEDFGQVPVESMAAGKPCLGSYEGGLKETIINGKTGWHIEAAADMIIGALNTITSNDCKKMRKACERRAKKFDIKKYIKSWEAII